MMETGEKKVGQGTVETVWKKGMWESDANAAIENVYKNACKNMWTDCDLTFPAITSGKTTYITSSANTICTSPPQYSWALDTPFAGLLMPGPTKVYRMLVTKSGWRKRMEVHINDTAPVPIIKVPAPVPFSTAHDVTTINAPTSITFHFHHSKTSNHKLYHYYHEQ